MKQNQQSISPVEESILTVLDRYELYGLEIIKALEEGSKGKLKLGVGTLYPTLRRLEKKGLIEARWGDERPQELEGARRRYYQNSQQGKKVLRELQQMRLGIAEWKPVGEGTLQQQANILGLSWL